MKTVKVRYAWAPGAHCDGDVQKVGVALHRLREKGQIKPADVVTAARNPKSPLHDAIKWDWEDKIAAQKWREGQAQYLIRHVHVVMEHDAVPHQTRAFVNVRPDDGVERSYMTISDVLHDTNLRQQLIERAGAELRAWQRRYQDLVEFADVFAVIESLPLKEAA